VNEHLKKYNLFLVAQNKTTNLTARRSEDSSWKYNILDSLLFLDVIKGHHPTRLLDLGSGCGSPAIPIKIALSETDITMIDSVRKKTNFLAETISHLEIDPNTIRAIHARIEDLARNPAHHEQYDIVTARAVAPLSTLVEYAIPFLKTNGVLLAFKGQNVSDEINAAENAIKILNARVEAIHSANLDEETTRRLVVIKKLLPTPKTYPRGKNLPRLRPL